MPLLTDWADKQRNTHRALYTNISQCLGAPKNGNGERQEAPDRPVDCNNDGNQSLQTDELPYTAHYMYLEMKLVGVMWHILCQIIINMYNCV